MRTGILTISDRCARGEREDKGGPLIREIMKRIGGEIIAYQTIPDEAPDITAKLAQLADEGNVDLVLTTGGTGFSPRDHTPEATLDAIDKRAAGLEEAMRMEGYRRNKRAILSRGVCGIRKQTLIINLPGSPRAIEESLEAILPVLPHAIDVLRGEIKDCDVSGPEEKK
jgi:molybdenum cofactor synthesis domain-containing protein